MLAMLGRRKCNAWAATVVPRLLSRRAPISSGLPLGHDVWQDTRLLLPDFDPQARLRNIFTGELHTVDELGGSLGTDAGFVNDEHGKAGISVRESTLSLRAHEDYSLGTSVGNVAKLVPVIHFGPTPRAPKDLKRVLRLLARAGEIVDRLHCILIFGWGQ